MKLRAVLIAAASVAALAACASNEPAPREVSRMEPRPAPITSPTAREIPSQANRIETARIAPRTDERTPVVTGPMGREMDLAALIGTDVKDPAGQTIGEIDNVLLDRDGRVESVIVTTGGFMGIGGRDVELRWNDLKTIEAGNEVRVEMTAMQLRQRPEYLPNASGAAVTTGIAP